MRPCLRLRHAGDQRPVDLARRARAEGLGQRRGGKARLRHQQAAGGVLVEPVHQARALRVGVRAAQGAQHAVEMARGAGAALHGEPHRLVEHQHVVVFVERDRLDEGAVLLRLRRVVARLRRARAGAAECARPGRLRSRFFGCVRLPFTRTSPLRMMRWIWLNDRPGNRASKKRSTRMPFSSGVTATVCTPAENCARLRRDQLAGGGR